MILPGRKTWLPVIGVALLVLTTGLTACSRSDESTAVKPPSNGSCSAALRFGGQLYEGTSAAGLNLVLGERLGQGDLLSCREDEADVATEVRAIDGIDPETAVISSDDARTVFIAAGKCTDLPEPATLEGCLRPAA